MMTAVEETNDEKLARWLKHATRIQQETRTASAAELVNRRSIAVADPLFQELTSWLSELAEMFGLDSQPLRTICSSPERVYCLDSAVQLGTLVRQKVRAMAA